jgi:D-sedoheptulose 7-phosphate isomerase
MRTRLLKSIEQSMEAVAQLRQPSSLSFLEQSAQTLAHAFSRGNKVILAGNGGSLCDATHCAEEFVGIFRQYRRPLPAIALSEPGYVTCVGNDLGFEWIFARGLEAYAKPGDVFIGLTTSGQSLNIIKAFEMAKTLSLETIAFLGKGGGQLKGVADLELCIETFKTSDRIQEAHMAALHMLVEAVEILLFPEVIPLLMETSSSA